MKCIACGYFNLPQALTCGKCGMDLAHPTVRAGGSLGESLYPPRARDLTPWDRVQRRVRVPQMVRPPVRLPALPPPAPLPELWASLRPWMMMTVAILPGAGHALLADTRRALMHAGLFFAALGLALLLLHSWVSDSLLCAALGLSLFSVWEVAGRAFPPAADDPDARYYRALRLGCLSIATVAGTLASIYWLAGQWYPLYHLTTDASAPGLAAGDDVVEQHLARPLVEVRRGDIVLVQPNAYPIIERVLGLPGDRVDYADGVLWINGRRIGQESLPLSAAALRAGGTFDTVVPAGQICLWRVPAGYYPEAGEGGGPAPATSFATVAAEDIEGRILGVLGPPAHRRWFPRLP